MHICILYAEAGLQLDTASDDPYFIPGFGIEYRPYLKQVLNLMINSEDDVSACRAIAQVERKKVRASDNTEMVFSKEKLPDGYSHQMDIINAFKAKHQAISDAFCSGEGSRLQFIDSQVAEAVMLEMWKEYRQVALPIHDSFIVRSAFKEVLNDLMEKHFMKIVYANCKVKASKLWLHEVESGSEVNMDQAMKNQERELTDFHSGRQVRQFSKFWKHQTDWHAPDNLYKPLGT